MLVHNNAIDLEDLREGGPLWKAVVAYALVAKEPVIRNLRRLAELKKKNRRNLTHIKVLDRAILVVEILLLGSFALSAWLLGRLSVIDALIPLMSVTGGVVIFVFWRQALRALVDRTIRDIWLLEAGLQPVVKDFNDLERRIRANLKYPTLAQACEREGLPRIKEAAQDYLGVIAGFIEENLDGEGEALNAEANLSRHRREYCENGRFFAKFGLMDPDWDQADVMSKDIRREPSRA
jgi:hypothetical protein